MKKTLKKKLALAVALSLMTSGTCFALPEGENVRSGNAVVTKVENIMSITHTGKTAIDWTSFSIGAGEKVYFNQDGGIALNRVIGSDPSSILGQIHADGTVILLNPNGILFGNGAVINAGSFYASTAKVSDDFMDNFSTMNLDMSKYKDVMFTYVTDTDDNIINVDGIVKADKLEIGNNGNLYLKSDGKVETSGLINATNLAIGGTKDVDINAQIENTGDLVLGSKRNLNIKNTLTSTGDITLIGDLDQDGKGMVDLEADVKTGGNFVSYAPSTGTYVKYEGGEGKIDAENGTTTFYGNVAVDNSTMNITTKDFKVIGGNVDSANSYKILANIDRRGATVKDDPDIKNIAKYYYESNLKDVVYKDFEDLTEAEYNAIKDRCFDTYQGYKNRKIPKGDVAIKEVVQEYFNTHVKIDGLTEATDFDNLSDAQYTQLAKHILTTYNYTETDNRESILNNWGNAVKSATEGTAGGADVGDKYMATITDSLENWRVTSMIEDQGLKGYEYLLGGRTAIVGKKVKDGREFYWLTGIEGAKNDGTGTKFFTSSGVNEGTTHTYSAWSKDPRGLFNYVFEEPNNNGPYDQPYVAIGWHDNSGNGWADVDQQKNTVRGLVQENNNARSIINVTLTGDTETGTIDGKVGDSVPITINYIRPQQDPDPVNPDPVDPEPQNPDNPDPVDPTPDNPDPVDPTPDNPDPVDPNPDNPDPTNPDPVDPEPQNPDNPDPVDPTPDNPNPVDPDPTNPDPVDPTPDNPDPVDPTPQNPDPVDPTPDNPDPVDPTPQNPDPVNPNPPGPDNPNPVDPTPGPDNPNPVNPTPGPVNPNPVDPTPGPNPNPVDPTPGPVDPKPQPGPVKPDPKPVNPVKPDPKPQPGPVKPDPKPVNPVKPDPKPVNPVKPTKPDKKPDTPDKPTKPVKPVDPTPIIPEKPYTNDDNNNQNNHEDSSAQNPLTPKEKGVIILNEKNGNIKAQGKYEVFIDDSNHITMKELQKKPSVPSNLNEGTLVKQTVKVDGGKYAVGYNGSLFSIEPIDKTAQKAVQKGNGDVKHNVDVILRVMNASFSDTGLDVETLNYICIHIK